MGKSEKCDLETMLSSLKIGEVHDKSVETKVNTEKENGTEQKEEKLIKKEEEQTKDEDEDSINSDNLIPRGAMRKNKNKKKPYSKIEKADDKSDEISGNVTFDNIPSMVERFYDSSEEDHNTGHEANNKNDISTSNNVDNINNSSLQLFNNNDLQQILNDPDSLQNINNYDPLQHIKNHHLQMFNNDPLPHINHYDTQQFFNNNDDTQQLFNNNDPQQLFNLDTCQYTKIEPLQHLNDNIKLYENLTTFQDDIKSLYSVSQHMYNIPQQDSGNIPQQNIDNIPQQNIGNIPQQDISNYNIQQKEYNTQQKINSKDIRSQVSYLYIPQQLTFPQQQQQTPQQQLNSPQQQHTPQQQITSPQQQITSPQLLPTSPQSTSSQSLFDQSQEASPFSQLTTPDSSDNLNSFPSDLDNLDDLFFYPLDDCTDNSLEMLKKYLKFVESIPLPEPIEECNALHRKQAFFTPEQVYKMYPHNKSLVMIAMAKGFKGFVKVLLHRAERDGRLLTVVNHQDLAGRTPLIYAVHMKDHQLIHLLLSKGADVNVNVNENRVTSSLLGYVVEMGDALSVLVLLLRQEDVKLDVADSIGRTPLSRAIRTSQIQVILHLIVRGASISKLSQQDQLRLNALISEYPCLSLASQIMTSSFNDQ